MKQEVNLLVEDAASVTSQGSFRSTSSTQRLGNMKASKMMDIKQAKLMGEGDQSTVISADQLTVALYEVIVVCKSVNADFSSIRCKESLM